MSGSTKNSLLSLSVSGLLSLSAAVLLLAGCAPRVATSFWRIGTPADSTRAGYAVLHEGRKVRHCYPVTEWTDTASLQILKSSNGKSNDTYHSFHHHGVAVESEQMAYRIYFDKKQTIDVYCKRTPRLELASSYWYPDDSLLALGYGDDILRVSGTVGVGSVKYWDTRSPLNAKRSPLRHIEPVAERSQRIVRQSRNKATVEVAVKGWQPNKPLTGEADKPIDMSVQYTLCAGHRDMRCDVTLSHPVHGLCTGVQSIPNKGQQLMANSQWLSEQLPNGTLLASWGTDWPVNDTVKYAKETVGLAVFIPKQYAGEQVQDASNNLCLLNALPLREGTGVGCHFYLTCVGATKEDNPVATNAAEWTDYLRRWAATLK